MFVKGYVLKSFVLFTGSGFRVQGSRFKVQGSGSGSRFTSTMTITREIRYAARGLRKNLGFALVVVLTLGFGIGANAAIFSLMDQVLLRSLPVRDPSQLVLLDGPGAFQGRTFNRMTFSYPMYVDFRDRNEVFSGVLARFPTAMTVVWQGRSERASGDIVSGNFFDVLGVGPAIGRVFNASDDRTPGAHPVAVLSYGYWQRRFGGDPAVLDQTLVVNGHPMTIIGVAAQGFTGMQVGSTSDVMVPMMMKAQMTPTWNDLDNRRSRWVTIMGRLKSGVTPDAAEVQLNVVYKQINQQEIHGALERHRLVPSTFREQASRGSARERAASRTCASNSRHRSSFSCAWSASCCSSRARTSPTCCSHGRPPGRKRSPFDWRLAPAGVGSRASISSRVSSSRAQARSSAWCWRRGPGRFLLAALPGDPTAQTLTANPDARVVLFTLLLAIVTALLFGIGPALSATRPAVVTALKDEAGSVVGGGKQARARRVLVVAQVALSMLLLSGAGLFARSLYQPPLGRSRISGREAADLLAGSVAQRLRPVAHALPLRAGAGGHWRGSWRPERVDVGDRRVYGKRVEHDGQSRRLSAEGRRGHESERRRHRSSLLRDAGRHARCRARVHRQRHGRVAQSRHHQRNHGEVFFSRRQPDRPAVRFWSWQAVRDRNRRRRQGSAHGPVERKGSTLCLHSVPPG